MRKQFCIDGSDYNPSQGGRYNMDMRKQFCIDGSDYNPHQSDKEFLAMVKELQNPSESAKTVQKKTRQPKAQKVSDRHRIIRIIDQQIKEYKDRLIDDKAKGWTVQYSIEPLDAITVLEQLKKRIINEF